MPRNPNRIPLVHLTVSQSTVLWTFPEGTPYGTYGRRHAAETCPFYTLKSGDNVYF